jgi:hypothetical protein
LSGYLRDAYSAFQGPGCCKRHGRIGWPRTHFFDHNGFHNLHFCLRRTSVEQSFGQESRPQSYLSSTS